MPRRLIAILGIALAVASGAPLVLARQVEGRPAPGEAGAPSPADGDEPDVNPEPLLPAPTVGQPRPIEAPEGGGEKAANPPRPAAGVEEGAAAPGESPDSDRLAIPPREFEPPAGDEGPAGLPPRRGGSPTPIAAPSQVRSAPMSLGADDAPKDPEVHPAQGQEPSPPGVAADRFPMGMHSVGLTVEMVAPPSANLNKPLKYTIKVKNTGTADALGVVVADALPAALRFEASKPEPTSPAPALTWKKDVLPAGSEWVIEVTAVPVAKETLEHAAVVTLVGGSRARTQVRKPALKVEQRATVSRELKGRQVEFKINVANVGDGPARGVALQATLSPGLRHAQGQVLELEFKKAYGKSALAPGESHEVSLVADAVAGGPQTCSVVATSPDVEDAPEAKSVQKVEVIEPQLNLAFARENKRGYPDMVATYTLRVENPGSAPAKGVRVVAYPSSGGRVQSKGGGRYVAEKRALVWDVPQLGEGESKEFTFQVLLGGPQMFRIQAIAVAEGGLRKEIDCKTEVVGAADVDFTIAERQRGGLSIGDKTSYVIKITNQGTESARNIQVHGLLSKLACREIEDPSGKDGVFDKKEGKVLFQQVPELPPGETLELTIHAEAVEAGLGRCQVFLTHQGLRDDERIDHTQFTRIINPADAPN